MEEKSLRKSNDNIFTRIWWKLKSKFTKQKTIPEPQEYHYDEGVNIVVMKKDNFENLKVNIEKMNKKVKLDNGFISVDDLSDEEIEEMIQLYTNELNEIKRNITAKQLELDRIKKIREKIAKKQEELESTEENHENK